VNLVATSNEPHHAPIALKKEYIESVRMNKTRRDMKNCDAVLCRFDMKYTTTSNMITWTATSGRSTTT
jgi:hypothetical protein